MTLIISFQWCVLLGEHSILTPDTHPPADTIPQGFIRLLSKHSLKTFDEITRNFSFIVQQNEDVDVVVSPQKKAEINFKLHRESKQVKYPQQDSSFFKQMCMLEQKKSKSKIPVKSLLWSKDEARSIQRKLESSSHLLHSALWFMSREFLSDLSKQNQKVRCLVSSV